MNIFRNLWAWVSGQLIGEVPEGDALCEYDCRKLQCTEGEWETCSRRLGRAAGELMPAEVSASEGSPTSTNLQKTSVDPNAKATLRTEVNQGD